MCYVNPRWHRPPEPQLKGRATAWPQKPSPVVSEVRTVFGGDTWQLPWTTSRGWLVWGKQWRYVRILSCVQFSRKSEKLCVLHLKRLQMQMAARGSILLTGGHMASADECPCLAAGNMGLPRLSQS